MNEHSLEPRRRDDILCRVDDEDDPALQAEVARRLLNRAVALREANDNEAVEPDEFDAAASEDDLES